MCSRSDWSESDSRLTSDINRMNWEAINAVSRFVSSIAVVFSVLYLGIEVHRGHSIACGSIVHNARLIWCGNPSGLTRRLDVCLEPRERAVPLLGDEVEVILCPH